MLVKVAMVGVQHPHMFARISYFKANVNLVGFFDDDRETANKLAGREPEITRYMSLEHLLSQEVDCVFVHSLDHDVPRYAREIMNLRPDLKGLFLEKPGAAFPEDLFALNDTFSAFPNLLVEFGWEMHYSEMMDYARDIVAKGVLGDITSCRFHGGTPSGGSLEKWQSLDTLGGFVYTDATHTFEQIVDLFGLPKRVVASIRKLPVGKEKFKCVNITNDLFEEPKLNSVSSRVGTAKHEDIGSVIMEYTDKNVTADFTAWEATDWCEDWSIDMYGCNGTSHAVLNPPKGHLYLIEGRCGFVAGESSMSTILPNGESNWMHYFDKQIKLFLDRCKESSAEQICGKDLEMKLMKLMAAVFKSAKTGSFVSL